MSDDDAAGQDHPFDMLPSSQRRRLVAAASLRAIGTIALVVAIYFLVPMDRSLGPGTVIGVVLGLLALFAAVGWEIGKITQSDYPTVRGVEALALIVPLFILLFATAYFLMDHADGATFGSPVTRVDAMYFSATVFTTVGFGDIVAKTEAARVLVTVQMM